MVQRDEAEWPELDPRQPFRRKRPFELELLSRAVHRPATREESHGLRAQAASGERDHLMRGGVEPLQVVDGDQHRPVAGDQAQRTQECCGDGALVGLLAAGSQQQRDLQRTPLGLRKLRQYVIEQRLEQVAEPREGELGLDLDGPGGEHTVRAGSSSGHTLAPESRLPDPRLALELQRAGAALRAIQQATELCELRFPADQPQLCHVHAASYAGRPTVAPPLRAFSAARSFEPLASSAHRGPLSARPGAKLAASAFQR